ncbi:MAG: tetratricopeptide repeat protein, partial [Cyclobacteriaceae bacterium]|nr:tetratricopeptide repeat protein [Cyclobacteriaceae bacterium]
MKFIKNISQTFVPFLILLVLIMIAIIYFDVLAERLSNEPDVIVVSTSNENEVSENFWEFESEVEDTNDDYSWRSDSIYLNGKMHYDNKEWDKAENYFLSLTNSYSNSPQLLNLLGLIQYKKRDYDHAISTFDKCLLIAPNYSAALTNLAILYVKINRYADAEKVYKQGISANPNNPKPYLNLGILYCKNQKWDEVNNYLSQAKSLASGSTKSKILYYSG